MNGNSFFNKGSPMLIRFAPLAYRIRQISSGNRLTIDESPISPEFSKDRFAPDDSSLSTEVPKWEQQPT